MRSIYRFLGLFILFIQCFFVCVAQKPEWIRNSENTEGSSGKTDGKRVAVHPDGNVFVLGQYSGDNIISGQSLNIPPNTIGDSFLAKYNPNGDLIWVKQLFQSDDWLSNKVIDLKVDHQGDLVFTGSCLSASSILGSEIGVGAFISKIDADGNLLWLKFAPLAGGSLAEHHRRGIRIGFDADNNILWITDQINEFDPSGALVVEKYAPDGTSLSSIPVTRNPSFYRPKIASFSVDAEGGFIISGNFSSTVGIKGGPFLTNNGSNFNPAQFFIASFDANGIFQWVVHSNYESNGVISQTIDHEGNLYISLQVDAGAVIYTPHGNVNVSSSQISIAKFSKSGHLEWINPTRSASAQDIFLAPDGLLYVTGIFFGDEFRYQSYVRANPSKSNTAYILKINTKGDFYGFFMGEPVDEPLTFPEPLVDGYQSVVNENGDIYTMGDFWDGQVWGCVSAVARETSFFLVKHSAAESPIQTVTGPSTTCDGTEITLSTDLASDGILYKWFIPGAIDPGPGTLLNNTISIIAKYEYNGQPVIVSIIDDCEEYFSEPFILNIESPPKKPQLEETIEIVCPGSSRHLIIAGSEEGVTYQWSVPDGISTSALIGVGGEFFFEADFVEGDIKITATDGCATTDTSFHINTFIIPETPLLSENQMICPDLINIEIAAQPVENALSYEWDLPSYITFNPHYDDNLPTLRAIVETEFVSGEIKVRAVGECKSSDASAPVEISRVPTPENAGLIDGPEQICIGIAKVQFSIPPVDESTEYVWTVPDFFNRVGTIITTEPKIELEALVGGSGTLSVAALNSCQVSGMPTSISVTSYLPLSAPELTISDCDGVITVGGAENFSWFVNDELILQNSSEKTMIISAPGVYYATAENFCGVVRSNKIEAYPVLMSNLLIPNVVTPNGDGKNDFFEIDSSLQKPSVEIVNRWGQTIYYSSAYENKWSGDDVSPGIYYLVVRHSCLPQERYIGWLSVIK